MPLIAPLPEAVRRHLDKNTHAGLMLDKYVESWDPEADSGKLSERVQKPAVEAVVKLSQSPPQGFDYSALLQRWKNVASARGAASFRAQTIGPLTLHLARASALENAGICLHPLYGFAYLPGSGLKGLARAYAETLWLPAQSNQREAWRQIEDAFGWAPNPDRRRQINDPSHPAQPRRKDENDPKSPEIKASSGAIVFHDAWPESWPRLIVDIVNNHHPAYYQHDDNEHAPGDWENPVPVYFLAVPPAVTFTFALAKRRDDVPDELLALAKQWLLGALCHLGAGAKTAAGYGAFKPEGEAPPPLPTEKRAVFETTLELVTPAFVAGASQQPEDCDLRPATLRGLLRWWWRTMHAGFVDVRTLRALEAAVWGDTNRGGAVRVTVQHASDVAPLLYDREFICRNNRLPQPPNDNTTQGLWYHSFGMDDTRREGGKRRRHQRWFLAPGARWLVMITARPSSFVRRDARGNVVNGPCLLTPSLLLDQAKSALWLLCHFGGVGSKSRKGFGSLAVPGELAAWDRERCTRAAKDFRDACSAPTGRTAGSPALEHMLTIEDVPTSWTNYWYALDQLAAVAQLFAQGEKHNVEKKTLGLPRNVRPPLRGSFQPGPNVRKTNRHASPVFYHVARGKDGLTIRAAAFPSPELPADPTMGKSRRFLQRLLDHLRRELPRVGADVKAGRTSPSNARNERSSRQAPAPATPVPQPPSLPQPGSLVPCVLLEERTKKGGWKAKIASQGLEGPIVNTADVPADKKAGDSVSLIVSSISADGKQIQFRWPTAADDQARQGPRSSRR